MLRIAIDTAINPLLPVRQTEFMHYFLFYGRYASWVLAFDYVCHHFGKLKMLFFRKFSVYYPVDCYVGVYVPQHIQIDIDILLYDEEIILTSSLTIPHPHMKERRFVLEPMAQIAPQLIIPNETKTIAELLADIC